MAGTLRLPKRVRVKNGAAAVVVADIAGAGAAVEAAEDIVGAAVAGADAVAIAIEARASNAIDFRMTARRSQPASPRFLFGDIVETGEQNDPPSVE